MNHGKRLPQAAFFAVILIAAVSAPLLLMRLTPGLGRHRQPVQRGNGHYRRELQISGCTQTLAAGADIADAVSNASAGSTICLNPGTYGGGNTITINRSHGAPGAPITLTSADHSNPAVISGRLVIDGSANHITVTRLIVDWVLGHGNATTAVSLSADHVNLTHSEVNGGTSATCINPTDYKGSGWTNGVIDHVIVHHCLGDPIHTQGIYTDGSMTGNDTITNNWCYDVAARCYQMRGGHNIVWHNNTADDANYGVIFGDSIPTNMDFYNNIVGPDLKMYASSGYSAGGSIIVALTGGGLGNSAHDNCLDTPINFSTGTIAHSGNTITSVQFVNRAAGNLNLTSASQNSACQSYEVQGGNPGPNGAL